MLLYISQSFVGAVNFYQKLKAHQNYSLIEVLSAKKFICQI